MLKYLVISFPYLKGAGIFITAHQFAKFERHKNLVTQFRSISSTRGHFLNTKLTSSAFPNLVLRALIQAED